jgi:hypothetical protein
VKRQSGSTFCIPQRDRMAGFQIQSIWSASGSNKKPAAKNRASWPNHLRLLSAFTHIGPFARVSRPISGQQPRTTPCRTMRSDRMSRKRQIASNFSTLRRHRKNASQGHKSQCVPFHVPEWTRK